jgi:type IV pilus assembly protein PilV
MKNSQQGAMLLEAMIGILIFSMGILGIVGMQARAITFVSDAMYRSQASFLANEIIGQIWVNRGVAGNNVGNFAFPGGNAQQLATWIAKVNAELPGTAANPPTIAVIPATNTVTVQINWQPRAAATLHNLVTIVQVSDP